MCGLGLLQHLQWHVRGRLHYSSSSIAMCMVAHMSCCFAGSELSHAQSSSADCKTLQLFEDHLQLFNAGC